GLLLGVGRGAASLPLGLALEPRLERLQPPLGPGARPLSGLLANPGLPLAQSQLDLGSQPFVRLVASLLLSLHRLSLEPLDLGAQPSIALLAHALLGLASEPVDQPLESSLGAVERPLRLGPQLGLRANPLLGLSHGGA